MKTKTANECRCGKPARDVAYACDDCGDELAKALGDCVWLDEELETTITRQKAATYDGSPSRGAEKPTPVNWAASEARTHLHAILVSWARLCAEEQVRSSDPRTDLPANTLTGLSQWMLWRVDGLMLHEAGSDAVEEICSAVAHCMRLVDSRPERKYIGPCQCGRDLYGKPGAKMATCEACGWEYDAAALWAWMSQQVMGRLVSAREGATLLSRYRFETKQGTIDKWRERGRLAERAHNAQGHRLYLFDDLLTLAQHAADKAGA